MKYSHPNLLLISIFIFKLYKNGISQSPLEMALQVQREHTHLQGSYEAQLRPLLEASDIKNTTVIGCYSISQ